jgi:molybdenum cofactor biosynthesis protein B
MSETALAHKAEAPAKVKVFILTCSTSKYKRQRAGEKVEDPSGDLIANSLKNAGHAVVGKKIVPDSEALIKQALQEALALKDVDAIIICGGTGIAPKDLTIEVAEKFFEKNLPGFGEIFRKLSYEKIGSPAILTRATAGIAREKAIFCLPGSTDAVETAMTTLIIPEIGHILKHAREP